MKTEELVTVYVSGAFGVSKIEGKIIDYGILKGINHPAPADPFGEPTVNVYDAGVVTSKATRYSCFDDNYKTEFDAKITDYLKNQTVLMDIRHTVQTQIVNK